jgi:hypothetical protein
MFGCMKYVHNEISVPKAEVAKQLGFSRQKPYDILDELR